MEGTLEEPGIKDSSRSSPDRHLKGERNSPPSRVHFGLSGFGGPSTSTFESESSGL